MSGEASSSLSSAEGVGKLSAFSSSSRGRSSTDLPDAGDSPTVSSTGTTPRKLMAGVRRVPSSQPKTSRVSPSPTKNSLSPADLMAIPGRNEILRLENELKRTSGAGTRCRLELLVPLPARQPLFPSLSKALLSSLVLSSEGDGPGESA